MENEMQFERVHSGSVFPPHRLRTTSSPPPSSIRYVFAAWARLIRAMLSYIRIRNECNFLWPTTRLLVPDPLVISCHRIISPHTFVSTNRTFFCIVHFLS